MREQKQKMSLSKAIEASLNNGQRILNDAEMLLYPESAPTAFALSVLAQEEFAKAFLLYLVETQCLPWDNNIGKALNDHSCKQLMCLL
ncbi:MAG: AbiV family abortive infection protein, partial [Pseudomonadota bacterium]